MKRLSPAVTQRVVASTLWALAGATILVLLFIVAYILVMGLPHISWEFLTQSPRAMGRKGGVLSVVVGTLLVTGMAVAIAGPVGVATAVYLTEYARQGRLTSAIRFGADCLAGIPSIIFGLFGFVFFVITLGMGFSIVSGALTLALMVLPTVIRTSEEAIRSVPWAFREASYGLGSTRWQMVTRVVLGCALPGIGTGLVLAVGRSISETAAVMLTAGSALGFPDSAFSSTRTLALHFYVLAREGISMPKAYATATVLVVAILAINIFAHWLTRRLAARAA
jgi:phosphate transport system permease protein